MAQQKRTEPGLAYPSGRKRKARRRKSKLSEALAGRESKNAGIFHNPQMCQPPRKMFLGEFQSFFPKK